MSDAAWLLTLPFVVAVGWYLCGLFKLLHGSEPYGKPDRDGIDGDSGGGS